MFGRRPKLKTYFLLESLSWVQMGLHTKFLHPSYCSFWYSCEEYLTFDLCFGRQPTLKPFLRFVFWKTTYIKPIFIFLFNFLLVRVGWACIQSFIILALVVFEIAVKKTLNLCFGRWPKLNTKLFCLNLLVGVRWTYIQNFIILALVVFEIAIWKTLHICIGRRPKLNPYFFCLNLLVGVRWACIQKFIILALLFFEIAMKKTLHFF